MKVKELIEELSKLSQDAMVVVSGYEGGVNEMHIVSSKIVQLNVNTSWYYGNHEIEYEIDSDIPFGVAIPETHAFAVHLY